MQLINLKTSHFSVFYLKVKTIHGKGDRLLGVWETEALKATVLPVSSVPFDKDSSH